MGCTVLCRQIDRIAIGMAHEPGDGIGGIVMTLLASDLPDRFTIESSYHMPITGMVLHRGVSRMPTWIYCWQARNTNTTGRHGTMRCGMHGVSMTGVNGSCTRTGIYGPYPSIDEADNHRRI